MSGSQDLGISGSRGLGVSGLEWPGVVALAFSCVSIDMALKAGPWQGLPHIRYRTWWDWSWWVPAPTIHHPGYTPAPWSTWRVHAGTGTGGNSAMGSKMALRNSLNHSQVDLERTICLLAPFSEPCCKNRPVPKAPDYLVLSNPPRILLRLVTLP